MDCDDHKFYHVHGLDSRAHLDTYMSDQDKTFEDDIFTFPMKKFHSTFHQGHITGQRLIDFSYGSFVYHLYSVSKFFKEIILVRVSDSCIMEINKWVNARTGAFDWTHASKVLAKITGNSDCDVNPDTNLKATIMPVLRCDLNKENLTDPGILTQADCLITAGFLDTTSKDEDGYMRTLKKFVTLVKPGGHLILFGLLNATYFMMGEQKYHIFKCDAKFVREALVAEGLIIDDCEVHERKAKTDLVDYDSLIFIAAHKDQ